MTSADWKLLISKILRKTPTITSERLAADPQAAKQATSRMNGTFRLG